MPTPPDASEGTRRKNRSLPCPRRQLCPDQSVPVFARTKNHAKEGIMLKFIGGTVGVIFLIGLLVIIGLLMLIF